MNTPDPTSEVTPEVTPEEPQPLIDPEVEAHCRTCDELALYLLARNVAEMMNSLSQEWKACQIIAKKSRKKVDTSEIGETLVRARALNHHIAESTKRFGIKEPLLQVPSEIIGAPGSIKPSQDYINWFERWHHYIDEIPEEWWENVKKRVDDGEDTSDVRPPEGVVPIKWLHHKLPAENEADMEPYFEKVDDQHPKVKAMWNFMRSDDEMWFYRNPSGEEQGFTLVSNGRTVVSVALEEILIKTE